MLMEQRTYDIAPGIPLSEFLDSYEKIGLPAQKRILKGFVGYFVNEFGTQNQVHHFWAFNSLDERRALRAELLQDPDWQKCIAIVRPMIIHWENKIMYPTSFSPINSLPISSTDEQTAFTYR